ncbi:hypothetical protein [Leifsonia poae]|uniref:hypothetical protein n=1 Tax=Leifsonia poae TaxID=110933 RepID=UPI003D67E309
MSIAHASDIIAVWTEQGRPTRIVWRGTRYVVTDTPTPLTRPAIHDALTHPLLQVSGWRFQGASMGPGAEVRMFDVRRVGGDNWELIDTYR